jgi:ATP-dependent Clp protease ATP-binding subunit ClpA
MQGEIRQIVKIFTGCWQKNDVTDKKDIHIDFSEEVIEALARKGYD